VRDDKDELHSLRRVSGYQYTEHIRPPWAAVELKLAEKRRIGTVMNDHKRVRRQRRITQLTQSFNDSEENEHKHVRR